MARWPLVSLACMIRLDIKATGEKCIHVIHVMHCARLYAIIQLKNA